jgi:GTP-binding protein LepA
VRCFSGYVSFDYDEDGYREIELVKVGVRVNGKPVDEFSLICPHASAHQRAKRLVEKLRVASVLLLLDINLLNPFVLKFKMFQGIPRQLFEIDIKASIGLSKKIIAQAVIPPYKKDLTQKVKGRLDQCSLLIYLPPHFKKVILL